MPEARSFSSLVIRTLAEDGKLLVEIAPDEGEQRDYGEQEVGG